MIALQIISKILDTHDDSILENNLLTIDYFKGYEEQYTYIQDHKKQYGNIPDKATFLSRFPDIELVEVTESDKYLIDGIREEHLFHQAVPIMNHVAELLNTDANAAAEYMIRAIRDLRPNYTVSGQDIIAGAKSRYDQFIDRKTKQEDWFFTTGFEELDNLIHGIQREEEFFVIYARTNQGKSWVLEKICTHVWEIGFNVGYISPEMGANSVGYRFDTLHQNFSNKGLMWGRDTIDETEYREYIENLKQNKENRFVVSTPIDFDKKITISKLRQWIDKYKLDLIAIDGITYMTDERYKRGDNKTTTLTNISEDLMELSIELHVPVLVVVQSNRTGVAQDDSDGTPDLESIRDSDGIAHNASKVLSLRQTKDGILKMEVKKQRFGSVGGKLNYQWEIDTGNFIYIPAEDDAEPRERTERKVRAVRHKYSDAEESF